MRIDPKSFPLAFPWGFVPCEVGSRDTKHHLHVIGALPGEGDSARWVEVESSGGRQLRSYPEQSPSEKPNPARPWLLALRGRHDWGVLLGVVGRSRRTWEGWEGKDGLKPIPFAAVARLAQFDWEQSHAERQDDAE